jgi:hypothetical protein
MMEWWKDGIWQGSRGDLPVRPSTSRAWKHLQKFNPSGYPSEAVRYSSGTYLLSFRRSAPRIQAPTAFLASLSFWNSGFAL